MLQPLVDDEADFVVASRVLGRDTTTDRFRKVGVRVFSWIDEPHGPHQLTDTSNGYRALRVTMLDDVAYRLVQPQYQTAELLIIAMKRGWRVTERPTVVAPSRLGHHQEGQELALRLPLRPGRPRHLVARAAPRPTPLSSPESSLFLTQRFRSPTTLDLRSTSRVPFRARGSRSVSFSLGTVRCGRGLVVDRLERAARSALGGGVHRRAGHPTAPGPGRRRRWRGPTTTWTVSGVGMSLALGHGHVRSADADGHDRRARFAPTGRRHLPSGPRSTGPSRRVPSGKSTSTCPCRSTSSARCSASRSADSRCTGKAPTLSSRRPSHLFFQSSSLVMKKSLRSRAEGREGEVGERAVDGSQDHRPGRGHVLATGHTGPEPGPQHRDEQRPLGAVEGGEARVHGEPLVPAGSVRLGRTRRTPALRLAFQSRSQPCQHLLHHLVDVCPVVSSSVRPGASPQRRRLPWSSPVDPAGPRPRASSSLRRRARSSGRGRQVDLECGIREDDRADVAALDHAAAVLGGPRPLALDQFARAPRRWPPRPTRPSPTSGGADDLGDVHPVDGTRFPSISMRADAARAATAAGVGRLDAAGAPGRRSHRYMAPVSSRSTPRVSATACGDSRLARPGRAVDGHQQRAWCDTVLRRGSPGRRRIPGSWWPPRRMP